MAREEAGEFARALRLLGPLEGRIMRAVWSGVVAEPFAVRDMRPHLPELAYTTVMTTLHRLAEKGLLVEEAVPGRRAHAYRAVGDAAGFLSADSIRAAEEIVERYGEAALAAFAARLDALTPDQRRRLTKLGQQGA